MKLGEMARGEPSLGSKRKEGKEQIVNDVCI
jgi:hypothetical protein